MTASRGDTLSLRTSYRPTVLHVVLSNATLRKQMASLLSYPEHALATICDIHSAGDGRLEHVVTLAVADDALS